MDSNQHQAAAERAAKRIVAYIGYGEESEPRFTEWIMEELTHEQPVEPVAYNSLGQIAFEANKDGNRIDWNKASIAFQSRWNAVADAVETEVLKRADQAGFVKAGQAIDGLQRERDHALAQETGLRAITERLGAENERLKSQFPEGMERCTIKFISCPVGHGRLTATNWIDNGCRHCEIERLAAREKLAVDTIERLTRALDYKTKSEHPLVGRWHNASDSERITELESELASLKSSRARECEQLEAVCQLAISLGWNGIENSKFVSVFLKDLIDQLKLADVPASKSAPQADCRDCDGKALKVGDEVECIHKEYGCSVLAVGKKYSVVEVSDFGIIVDGNEHHRRRGSLFRRIGPQVDLCWTESPPEPEVDFDGHFETYQDAMHDLTKILGMIEDSCDKPTKEGE